MAASGVGDELQMKSLIHYVPINAYSILVALVPITIYSGSAGVFYPAMSEHFGVPISQITMYQTLGTLLAAFTSLLVGNLLSRYDVRLITSALAIVDGLSCIGIACAPNVYTVWFFGALLVASSVPQLALCNPTLLQRWFKDISGTLIGIAAAFTGVGGIIFVNLGQFLIDTMGWQFAYVVFGLIVLLVMLPFTIFGIRSYPADRGMLPYATSKAGKKEVEAEKKAAHGWSVQVKPAQRSIAFVLVVICGISANYAVVIGQFFPSYANSLINAGLPIVVAGAGLATILSVA